MKHKPQVGDTYRMGSRRCARVVSTSNRMVTVKVLRMGRWEFEVHTRQEFQLRRKNTLLNGATFQPARRKDK